MAREYMKFSQFLILFVAVLVATSSIVGVFGVTTLGVLYYC
ncbi:hypothetical protein THZG08_330051 [Vibrio owensii]|uniref:Uncharacterized protein n=1 Tax=Vibrio owensii TaxID=696485 RepID=A0AAU9QC22_9VIBR|nr:hypothetical protein THZG08_330051 [Vibrio owensii]CAH1537910.1 hypothetical protein THF1D04_50157 [Vibrio owensii]CAH1571952.1 hypothetical protein THOA03_330051 [Vibrio owensii]